MRHILTAWESISELKVMVEVPSQSFDTLRERTDSCCTTTLVTFNSAFFEFFILPTDFRWYITNTRNTGNIEGTLRSVVSGSIIDPDLHLEYLSIDITECNTTADTTW